MTPFFVGWSGRSGLRCLGFLGPAVAAVLIGFGALAFALAVGTDDPGGGDVIGEMRIEGILIADPYPMIVTDAGQHTVLLSGGGKRGVQAEARPLDGKRVRAFGAHARRGDRDMLLVYELAAAPGEVPGEVIAQVREDLGTWRLTGEICDGKCVLGVMRPGNKAAHKACANVCLIGGVPPVFVLTTPVHGTRYLLMGGPDNRGLPDAFRDSTGVLRRMDGTLERIGDAIVFRTDVTKAVVP